VGDTPALPIGPSLDTYMTGYWYVLRFVEAILESPPQSIVVPGRPIFLSSVTGRMTIDLHWWEPITVSQAATIFASTPAPWWIAGGWAIDLFIGHQTRPHDDLDIQILRRDQLVFQETLSNWDLWAADPPGTLRPWQKGEVLDPRIHDIWCRQSPTGPWSLQLMLMDTEEDRWIFRRDRRITKPLAQLTRRSADGIPYIAPEVQLLFKSRPERRDKDDADFDAVVARLDDGQRRWLGETLGLLYLRHPWAIRLAPFR
jgi:hypothetical protein